MLYFLKNPINSNLSSCKLLENKSDYIYRKQNDNSEKFVYLKPIQLLNENFSINFLFINSLLSEFILHSREHKYEEAHSLHVKWLEENFGQYKTYIGTEIHYLTDDYDFYADYDPRSGSAEIICKVLN